MRFGHRFESRYYQKSTLSEDLIVAWPLDEASGTRYPDYGGTEFNLTDVNTVGTADAPTGIGGVCASFVPASTEYLYCADPFPPPTALGVSVWIYAAIGSVGICGQWTLTAGQRSWVLWLNISTITLSLSGNGTAQTNISGATVTANQWTLLTASWDGANATIYKNAVAATPAAFAGPLHNSTTQLSIGRLYGDTPANYFSGRIAQPLIWRRALTLAEITYLYNSGNGRPLSDWL